MGRQAVLDVCGRIKFVAIRPVVGGARSMGRQAVLDVCGLCRVVNVCVCDVELL